MYLQLDWIARAWVVVEADCLLTTLKARTGYRIIARA